MAVEYWVWLQKVLGYENAKLQRILADYGTAKAFYDADDEEKCKKVKLSRFEAEKLHKITKGEIKKVISDCKELGITMITPDDSTYPERLRKIAAPPAVVYCKGKFPKIDDEPCVTIVGPRKITPYGARSAFALAARLSRAGCLIISGGAVGGDANAHKGALKTFGKTVGVLGNGFGYNYLKTNEKLRDEISAHGCLITEFEPYFSASKITFPQRNRLMSALSVATVVIEAKKRSGTLITANYAAEQGKEVYAVAGKPDDMNYEGTNALIRDGAQPLTSALDILTPIAEMWPTKINLRKAYDLKGNEELKAIIESNGELNEDEVIKPRPKNSIRIKGAGNIKLSIKDNAVSPENSKNTEIKYKKVPLDEKLGLSQTTILLYNSTDKPRYTIDQLITELGLSNGEVCLALTELEIFGYVKSLVGGMYEFIEK